MVLDGWIYQISDSAEFLPPGSVPESVFKTKKCGKDAFINTDLDDWGQMHSLFASQLLLYLFFGFSVN